MGLGPADPQHNPFAAADAPTLEALAGHPWTHEAWTPRVEAGRVVAALDASMGHPGVPQSATGQTTLLTGEDAVALMGGHYGPWPGPRLAERLQRDTLFHAFESRAAGSAVLANAYSDGYLQALDATAGRHRRVRPGAALVAARAAGVKPRRESDRARGAAVAVDLAGDVRGRERNATRAELAREGAVLARLAAEGPFTFLDVWVTDSVGHRADATLARRLIERIDAFVDGVLGALPSHVALLLTSDHGNLEDAGTGAHTRAPVPMLLCGAGVGALASRDTRDLRDVRPLVEAVGA